MKNLFMQAQLSPSVGISKCTNWNVSPAMDAILEGCTFVACLHRTELIKKLDIYQSQVRYVTDGNVNISNVRSMQPGALRGVDLSFENVFHLSQFSRDVSHKLPGGLKTTNVAGTYFKLISGYAILQNCTDVTTASSEGSDMRTKHVLQIKKN